MRRPMFLVVACLALAGAAQVKAASGGTPRLKVPSAVTSALRNAGFPVRTRCGEIVDGGRAIPGCWLNVEWHHYSVNVVPHSSRTAARAAYKNTYSRWAQGRRMALVRNLVVYGFRVSDSDWQTIHRLVIAAAQ